MRGAVEPDSDDEDGSGSSASSSASTSQGDHSSYDSSEEQETRVRSLTRQLAETAVGVREMSKQLGRARVKSTIQSVMIITKARDNHLIKLTRELAIWLMTTPRNGRDSGLTVYVDSQLRASKRFDAEGIRRDYPHLFSQPKSQNGNGNSTTSEQDDQSEPPKSGQSSMNGSRISPTREESLLRYWTSDMCSRSPHLFDFVVTLGGDGTVLFCSWLFQRIVPPVMPFALGSLGFLTNFDFKDYQKVLKSALDTGIRVNLRMRFTATVYRATLPNNATVDKRRRRAIKSGKTGEIIMKSVREGGWEQIEKPCDANRSQGSDEEEPASRSTERPKRDKEVMCFSTRPVETFEVLNDLVVDRGPSPYVSLLEVFGDEHHLTTAQADGLCISTPTGSTAYSLSAGGSLVHPEIPAILISPICPHTLSFRPMLLPDSMELRIAVPYNSRSTAWASFDGRGRVELKQGDHIKVTASRYPFPTVCAENQSIDWFESISRTLKWNERQRQKSFVVVEEGEEDQAHDEKPGKEKVEKIEKQKQKEEEKPDTNIHLGKEEESKALAHHRSREEDDDDDDDEEDDDEGEEEKYDIDDTSAAATRSNSPT
ncbi:ATP-NAD kinase, partial [Meira miltonrushii]